jgi:hypothetical protein
MDTKCGKYNTTDTTKLEEGRKSCSMLQNGWFLKTLCQVEESSQKIINVKFYFYEVSKIV